MGEQVGVLLQAVSLLDEEVLVFLLPLDLSPEFVVGCRDGCIQEFLIIRKLGLDVAAVAYPQRESPPNLIGGFLRVVEEGVVEEFFPLYSFLLVEGEHFFEELDHLARDLEQLAVLGEDQRLGLEVFLGGGFIEWELVIDHPVQDNAEGVYIAL